MSSMLNAAEEIVYKEIKTPKNNKDSEESGRDYRRAADSFTLNHLQNSLSSKCDKLIEFQKKVLEQMDEVIGKVIKFNKPSYK